MSVTLAETAEFLRRCAAARDADVASRTERLRSLLPTAAERLRAVHGVGRVWVFGSMATGQAHAHSDVDLAVEGLEAPRYFPALAMLGEHFGADVDLIDLDHAPASLRERVAREGVAL